MTEHTMPAETVRAMLTALGQCGVEACVGGGWAVDALLGEQTRQHGDLDLWVGTEEFDALLAALTEQGVDRIYPVPGDRPWNFVLHDGRSRRVDLHVYEMLGAGRLHYGSVNAPFLFTGHDLSGEGEIAGITVRCERPDFALQNRTGYLIRDIDRHDVSLLCARFALDAPETYR